jgi:hypothetical protein
VFNFLIKNKKYFYGLGIFLLSFFPFYYTFATLSCSITTQAGCADTVILRMSGSDNAHAELPSQTTTVYNNNVVCCTGGTGLSNSCAETNKATIVKLSGVTNAHVELNSQSNYANNACLSSTYPGDELTIAYQASNCTGYDTTLFSMSNTPTNSQVGAPASYTNKVCAKITTQSLTFNISDYTAGFGYLTPAGLRYATGDNLGSGTEAESYAVEVSTNAPSGYGLYVKGDTLKNGSYQIDPIGGTNLTPSPGTKAFGMRAVATGGVGAVVSPYDGSGFAYDATNSVASTVASASSGNGVTTNYSIRTVATIDDILNYGNYSTNLTYIVVANY